MKPRERVEMALDHQRPDRCPMQISFTPEFAARLRADIELQGKQVHNPHGGGNTYEKELSFWGTIDEQRILPFGIPQDVANEVRLRLETVGYDGGLILAPTHHVQLDIPLENF
jgi:hypothetical protein